MALGFFSAPNLDASFKKRTEPLGHLRRSNEVLLVIYFRFGLVNHGGWGLLATKILMNYICICNQNSIFSFGCWWS